MPSKANRPCKDQRCTAYALPGESYCKKHLVKRGRSYQAKAWHRKYCTSGWTAARNAYLQRHPLCVECQSRGRLVAATVVDHIIPHRGDTKLFWDQGNWQTLCASCHSRKTAREDGGFGNQTRASSVTGPDAPDRGRGIKSLEPLRSDRAEGNAGAVGIFEGVGLGGQEQG